MIPVKDNQPLKTFPFVTYTVIAINLVIFMYELTLGTELMSFFSQYAVVPAQFFAGEYTDLFGQTHVFTPFELARPIFTSMFLHGGWMHIIVNMLYLWIFGDNIEDRLGHVRFLFFYIACGVLATCSHMIMNSESTVPSLGASGAVAGLLAAYVLLFPRARVLAALPIFFFVQLFEVPAVFFIGIWIMQQFIYGALSFSSGAADAGGVAWWAHIGGFLAGFMLVFIIKPRMINVVKQFRRRTTKPAANVYWPNSNPTYTSNQPGF